jgi:hypothetical protein
VLRRHSHTPLLLQDLPEACSSSNANSSQPGLSGLPGLTVADKFRAAYVQQAARLREKEQRLWKAQERRQLRASHALRALNAWLDEPA